MPSGHQLNYLLDPRASQHKHLKTHKILWILRSKSQLDAMTSFSVAYIKT